MSKGKIVDVYPEGSTMARADGSAVNVGDEIDGGDTITITTSIVDGAVVGPIGATVRIIGDARPTMIERAGMAAAVLPAPVVSDTATPARAARATMATRPAVKVDL